MLAQEGTLYSQCQASNWGISGRTIEYTYDGNGSVETKTTRSGNTTLEVVTYTYDLQNHLATATTDHQDGFIEHAQYGHSDSGIRLSSHTWTTQNGGSPQNAQTKLFLIDPDNHTGYAQILEEKQGGISTCSYTIGDDVLGQSKWNAGTSAYVNHCLLYDGHGSTRQLSSSAGTVAETYAYDAYGIELGGGAATANTSLLYSGEQYDSSLSQYYLRARYYDPSNGRFTQTDPFGGNNEDPQSLHKYMYCAADPVNGIDPGGLFTQGFGYAAEDAIQSVYRQDHLLDKKVSYGGWTRLGGLLGIAYRLKPDILNHSRFTWLEIKPLTQSGLVKAIAQFALYRTVLGLYGYLPETSWKPSVSLATVQGTEIFFFNAGGIVFYTDIVEAAKDLAVLGSIAAVQKFLRSPAGMRLIASELGKLGRIPGLVRARYSIDNARLRGHFTIASLLACIGAV